MGLLPEVHRAQNSASIVDWIVSPQNVQVHPETQNVTLFGNSVFADITKGLEIKSSWIEDVISERKRKSWTQRFREEGHGKTKAETGVILPEVKEQKPLEAERGKKALSPRSSGQRMALLILCFQTPDFQNCENINFCCFKTPTL